MPWSPSSLGDSSGNPSPSPGDVGNSRGRGLQVSGKGGNDVTSNTADTCNGGDGDGDGAD